MLMPIHRYAFFGLGLLIFSIVLYAIRKNKLTTEFSLLWFCTSLFLIIQIIPNKLSNYICILLHVQSVTLIFIVFVLFVTSILFYYSLLLSRISKNQKKLIQQLGLIEAERNIT